MSDHNKLIVFTRSINPRAYNLLLSQQGVVDLFLTKQTKESIRDIAENYDRVCGTFIHDEQTNEVEQDLNIELQDFNHNRLTMYDDNAYVICRPIKNRGVLESIEYYLLEGK